MTKEQELIAKLKRAGKFHMGFKVKGSWSHRITAYKPIHLVLLEWK